MEAGREKDRRQQGQARQPEARYETILNVDPITSRAREKSEIDYSPDDTSKRKPCQKDDSNETGRFSAYRKVCDEKHAQ